MSRNGETGASAPLAQALSPNVRALARQALDKMRDGDAPPSDRMYAAMLEAAAASDEPARIASAIDRLRQWGVSDPDLVDIHIPEAVRGIGRQWVSDELTFADVTIRTARLEAALRNAESRAQPISKRENNAPAVLVVVEESQQHTLGALVLADQFRRCGAIAKVSLCRPAEEVVSAAASMRPDIVAISAAASQRLDRLDKLIQSLRSSALVSPRIVVGGTILATEKARHIGSDIDVDAASCDIEPIFELCGFRLGSDRPYKANAEAAINSMSAQ